MDIVQITDRILVSIGIGMSAAFHLFRFSIMTLMPAIEDIKTDVMCEGLSLKRGLIITVGILVSISPILLAIKNSEQRRSLCIDLTWCTIGFCQEYVPKFGTHKRKKDSEKSRLEHWNSEK